MNQLTDIGEPTRAEETVPRPESVEALMRTVGERVRRARRERSLSRRLLSERSGVSERYLAQLEAGAGNISIGLLFRIAGALGHRVEWLVGADRWDAEAARFARLFSEATAEQRRQAIDSLGARSPAPARARRIALIGLRGAGKLTLGRLAGQALGLPFVELNGEIAAESGMPAGEVIALYGQEGYRRLEKQALERVVATHEAVMLAVAGGIVAEPDTYEALLRHSHTIWLKAAPEEHMDRVRGQGDHRPMAGNPKAMEELRSILTSREALYARAEAVVDTSSKTAEDSARDLVRLIEARGFLRA